MSATSRSLPAGRSRYEQTLVRTGLSPEVAYTLSEDVRAMAGATVHERISEQTRAIEALNAKVDTFLRLHVERGEEIRAIEARQAGAMKSSEERQEKAMKSFEARQVEAVKSSEERQERAMKSSEERQEKAMKSFEARQVEAMKSLGERQERAMKSFEERQEKAMKSFEAGQVEAMKSFEARQVEAMKSFEARQGEAMNSLEERQERAIKSFESRVTAQYDRLVGQQLKLLWTIVGSVLVTAVALVGKMGDGRLWLLVPIPSHRQDREHREPTHSLSHQGAMAVSGRCSGF